MGADYDPKYRLQTVGVQSVGDLAAGASYIWPARRRMHAITCTDADIVDLRIEMQAGGFWYPIRAHGVLWVGVQNEWVIVPLECLAAANRIRLTNSGANPITAIYVALTDE